MNGVDLIEEAERIQLETRHDPWRSLMIVLLHHLQSVQLPEVAESAVEVAARVWERGGDADRSSLLPAKKRCWAYLDSLKPTPDLATQAGRRTRAVLCVLEASGDDETRSMTADWFASMMWGDS
jgi:hypothetical protein